MAPRACACGREILMDEKTGPVARIRSLKFYESSDRFGHPLSRQDAFFCEWCTARLIEFLREIKRDGPGPREVAE